MRDSPDVDRADGGDRQAPVGLGQPPDYPARWESDIVLSDGGTAHVRPIVPGDADRLAAFHERQSSESIYFRFFSPRPKLSARDLERFTQVDYLDRMAFVALLGDDIIGMASYDRWRSQREAELSFIVDDQQQGRGLATVLLEFLIVAAREVGLAGLTAVVLPSNKRMLGVMRSAGFVTRSEFADGLIEVSITLDPSPEALAAIDERARRAEARSIERLLAPSSVAVIGASRMPGTIGNELLRQLLGHNFKGTVYPVNPSGEPVAGVHSYPSVLDIDDDVHLAVVAVPALAVLGVVEECGRKGVDGLVVLSAGFEAFGPYGETGARLGVERARRLGMRVIGPESLGIINTAPSIGLHATFADVELQAGRVGFLTQSGTLGLAALEHARRVGLGISSFVDVGSKIDVSGNDLLQYWEDDPRTEVIALYLESFGNPSKFTRLARRVGRSKPIVAVKSGNTRLLSERAADPDALVSWPIKATTDALLRQSGVLRVESPAELFNLCRLFAQQPVPVGRHVAIISNSHGATALTVDACAGAGLEIAVLSELTCGVISAAGAPPGASRQNPVDLTWAATPELYEAAVRAVLGDEGVDALVVIYAPAFPRQTDEVARAIGAAATSQTTTPIVATFLGSRLDRRLIGGSHDIPLFEFPAEAARALSHAATYGQWRSQPEGDYPVAAELGGIDLDRARAIVERALGEGGDGEQAMTGGWLAVRDTYALLEAVGLAIHEARVVDTAEGAVKAADEIGYPVAIKATGLPVLRAGEEGGAALARSDRGDVRATYRRMAARFGDDMKPAVVQAMVAGVEVQVTAHQHAAFGAVLAVGLGGPARGAAVEAAVRVLPLSDLDARHIIASSPIAPLLRALPDQPSTDAAEQLAAVLLRLAAVVEAVPELANVVLNPVSISAGSTHLLDARVRVAPYRWDPTPAVRRLA
ncbi:MAG: GNAT family N-acetyltransferase [Actinobacteria bacterium]|nr:GNAT family N-acetyltransferase [Actinomycetota bacterium]